MSRTFQPVPIAIFVFAIASASTGALLGIGLPATEPSTLPAALPNTRPTSPATLPTTLPASAATQPADPATKPADPARAAAEERYMQLQRQQRDNARQLYGNLLDSGDITLSQLVQLTEDRGFLKLEATPLPVPTGTRFKVKGVDNAVWTVNRSNSVVQNVFGPNGMIRTINSTSTTVTRVDLDVKSDNEVWSTYASSNGSYLSISGQYVKGRVSLSQNLTNRAAPMGAMAAAIPPVTLMVAEWQGMPNGGARQAVQVQCRAKSIAELRAKFPQEFRKHAIPLLAKISDLAWLVPGPADVYSAFPEIPADPPTTDRLTSLLPELDSDVASIRDAASAKLNDLGPGGVLAALRLDPESLSFEQKGQIGRWIAANRRRDLSPAESRTDTAFMSDCLEHPDPAVRAAAKSALEKLLGKPLDFDPAATGEALSKSADTTRKLVLELTAPATQPAADQPNAAPAAGEAAKRAGVNLP